MIGAESATTPRWQRRRQRGQGGEEAWQGKERKKERKTEGRRSARRIRRPRPSPPPPPPAPVSVGSPRGEVSRGAILSVFGLCVREPVRHVTEQFCVSHRNVDCSQFKPSRTGKIAPRTKGHGRTKEGGVRTERRGDSTEEKTERGRLRLRKRNKRSAASAVISRKGSGRSNKFVWTPPVSPPSGRSRSRSRGRWRTTALIRRREEVEAGRRILPLQNYGSCAREKREP